MTNPLINASDAEERWVGGEGWMEGEKIRGREDGRKEMMDGKREGARRERKEGGRGNYYMTAPATSSIPKPCTRRTTQASAQLTFS